MANLSSPVSTAAELIQTSDNNGNVHSLATGLMSRCLQSGPGGGIMLHCHHHRNSPIKTGSGVSHCNVSFIVKGQNHNPTVSKPQQKPRTERIMLFYLNSGFPLGKLCGTLGGDQSVL